MSPVARRPTVSTIRINAPSRQSFTSEKSRSLVEKGLLKEIHPIHAPPLSGVYVPGNWVRYELTKNVLDYTPSELNDLRQAGYNIPTDQTALNTAYQNLKNVGAVSFKGDQFQLNVPVSQLPDNLRDDALTLGFEEQHGISEAVGLRESPVRMLYEYVKDVPVLAEMSPRGIQIRKPGEATGSERGLSILGNIENTILAIPDMVLGLVGTTTFTERSSPSTISYARNLPEIERQKLEIVGLAGTAIGSYVSLKGAGFVVDNLFAGARTIAGRLGVSTSTVIKKISANKKLAGYVNKGVIIGLNTPSMVALYEAGTKTARGEEELDKFAFQIAELAVSIGAGYKGYEAGTKSAQKFRNWLKTRKIEKGKLFPAETLMSQRNLKGGKIYEYPKNLKPEEYSDYFKADARDHLGEEYLGKLTKGKYRVYHVGDKNLGERHIVQEYYSINEAYAKKHLKFPGLYTSSEPSKLRLGSMPGEKTSGNVGWPGAQSTSYMSVVDLKVDVIPKGLTHEQAMKWISNYAKKGVAYVPSVEFISAENEAIISMSTQMVAVRTGFGMQYGDKVTLVDLWNPVTNSQAVAMKNAGLTVKTYGEIIARDTRSSIALSDKLFTLGIAVPGQKVLTSISESDIARLSREYNMSESEVRLAISDFTSQITSSGQSQITTSNLKSIIEPSETTPLSVVPPGVVPLAKLKFPHLKSEVREYGKHVIKFEVKLLYPSASQRYVIKSKTFHNATQNALMRRGTKTIPKIVKVKVIKSG